VRGAGHADDQRYPRCGYLDALQRCATRVTGNTAVLADCFDCLHRWATTAADAGGHVSCCR
jgi:hypothetical protein